MCDASFSRGLQTLLPAPAPARCGAPAARVRFPTPCPHFLLFREKRKRQATSVDAAGITSRVVSFDDAGCRVPRCHGPGRERCHRRQHPQPRRHQRRLSSPYLCSVVRGAPTPSRSATDGGSGPWPQEKAMAVRLSTSPTYRLSLYVHHRSWSSAQPARLLFFLSLPIDLWSCFIFLFISLISVLISQWWKMLIIRLLVPTRGKGFWPSVWWYTASLLGKFKPLRSVQNWWKEAMDWDESFYSIYFVRFM